MTYGFDEFGGEKVMWKLIWLKLYDSTSKKHIWYWIYKIKKSLRSKVIVVSAWPTSVTFSHSNGQENITNHQKHIYLIEKP